MLVGWTMGLLDCHVTFCWRSTPAIPAFPFIPCHFWLSLSDPLEFPFPSNNVILGCIGHGIAFFLCWSIRGDTSYPLSFGLRVSTACDSGSSQQVTVTATATVTLQILQVVLRSVLYFGFLCLMLLVVGSPKSNRNRRHCKEFDICRML